MFVRAIMLLAMVGVPVFVLAQVTEPTETTEPAEQEPRPVRPSAEEMLDQMLRPTTPGTHPLPPIPQGTGIDRSTGSSAVAPGAPQLYLMPEGTLVLDRLVRLSRSPDGSQWEIIFDADGKTMRDPAMIVLPNRRLAQMQRAATDSGRDPRFRVTGEVTEYQGRNYILIHKAAQLPEPVDPL